MSATLDERERAARWSLWSLEGVGTTRLRKLLEHCEHHVQRLWEEPELASQCVELLGMAQRRSDAMAALFRRDVELMYEQELERLDPATDVLLYKTDPMYPTHLLELTDPPEFLYIRGDASSLLLPGRMALVGTRHPSQAQFGEAAQLSRAIADRGVLIVSGGARGMDTAAHTGALESRDGRTVAFLPGGLGHLTPTSNAPLFKRISARGGALISEYPYDVGPRRYHFARRNRLIAAASQGVLILKASAKGGTILTAKAALSLGRPVGALPYEAADTGARGSLDWLREGSAVIVRDVEDALSTCLGWVGQSIATLPSSPAPVAIRERGATPSLRQEPASVDVEPPENETWALIESMTASLDVSRKGGWVELDALVARHSGGASRVMAELLLLELSGAIEKSESAPRWRKVGAQS